MNYYRYKSNKKEFATALARQIDKSWFADADLLTELSKTLSSLFDTSINRKTNYVPEPNLVFRALRLPRQSVRVVILGQDPYPKKKHCSGLAFHANGEKTASLVNIKKNLLQAKEKVPEIASTLDGWSIDHWAEQGVLLINAAFTTVESISGEHERFWFGFTKKLLSLVPKQSVTIFMGAKARAFETYSASSEKVMMPHPAARRNEFARSSGFIEANNALARLNLPLIDWSMKNK